MVRSAVHNAFLNTLTMGTMFPRVPLEMTPGVLCDGATLDVAGHRFSSNVIDVPAA